ncbi:LIM-domain binding protein-domain-containing protein [Flagelloscypha sp. PMI_526]|nr:LIM-domain binding protein-domain-containing protein [Flagelloscypha sp. PMI_526]
MNASGPAPPPEGKGLSRFLSFTSYLCRETPHKFQLQWWRSVVHEHFAPSASMRMTLWKDNQSQEAKSFDVSAAILPRFFLVTSQSGVHSMSITLDGATERVESLVNNVQAIVIECQDSSWIFRYTNGYVVTLRGSLLVRMLLNKKEDNHDSMDEFGPGMDGRRPSLGGDAANLMGKKDVDWMFDQVIFDARGHEKYVSLASIRGIVGSTGSGSEGASSPGAGAMLGLEGPGTMANGVGGMVNGFGGGAGTGADDPHIVIENGSIPGEPVNAFGIPQPTMRCLEVKSIYPSCGVVCMGYLLDL